MPYNSVYEGLIIGSIRCSKDRRKGSQAREVLENRLRASYSA
jgi:hypothetical protein